MPRALIPRLPQAQETPNNDHNTQHAPPTVVVAVLHATIACGDTIRNTHEYSESAATTTYSLSTTNAQHARPASPYTRAHTGSLNLASADGHQHLTPTPPHALANILVTPAPRHHSTQLPKRVE